MIRPPEFAIGIRLVLGFASSEIARSASDTVGGSATAWVASSESRLETSAAVPRAIAATPTTAASVMSTAAEGRRLGGSSSGPSVLVRVGLEPEPGTEVADPFESGRATAGEEGSSTGTTIVTVSAEGSDAYGAGSKRADGNVEPVSATGARTGFRRRERT